MERPSRVVQDFSKKESGEERKELAQEIKGVRKSYFEKKKRISELETRVLEQEKSAEEAARELDTIEKEIEMQSSTLSEKLFSFFSQRYSAKLESLYIRKSRISERTESLTQTLAHMRKVLREELSLHTQAKEQFGNTKNTLNDFYHGELVKWQEKENRVRDVKNVMQKHDVLFVHAISPHYTPVENSVLRSGVEWKTKMKIALSLEPTLAISTIEEGDTSENMWHKIGFLLKGGRIESMSSRDAATRGQIGGSRITDGSQYFRETSEEQIELSIQRRERYNEFSVSHPDYAGLYVAIDEEEKKEVSLYDFHPQKKRQDQDMVREVCLFGKEMQLPVFVIKNGIPHRAEWDEKEGKMTLGDSLSTKDLLEQGRTLPPQEKAELLDEVLKESPFKLESIERVFLDSRNSGRLFYIQTHAREHPELFQEESYRESSDILEIEAYASSKFPNADITVLIDMPNINSPYNEHIKLFLADGKIYKWTKGRYEMEHEDRKHVREITEEDNKTISLRSGGGEIWYMPYAIKNTRDYLTAMQGIIEEVNQWEERSAIIGSVWQITRVSTLTRLAYHLYGYATEARRVGDTASAEEAERLAKTLVPKNKIEELVKKRIRKDGNFKVTKEDLGIAS